MKVLFYFILILGSIFASACTKQANNVKRGAISAFTIVNAVVNSSPYISDVTSADSIKAYFSSATQIPYPSAYEFSVQSGVVPTIVYSISDTNKPVFKGEFKFQQAGIYSLFLSGMRDHQELPDTLLTEDHPPFHPSNDSAVGIRFVNLSPDSRPLSINIQGHTSGSEAADLAYRDITQYKSYQATSSNSQYIFEIRDKESDSLLTTLNCPANPFQNLTVVVSGLMKGAGPEMLTTFLINNF